MSSVKVRMNICI